MNRSIKKVLKLIENEGFEAYVVGGYVRDLFLNKKSFDIDICTNALPKDLYRIFNCSNDSYGSVSFNVKNLCFDITTYRKELKYVNRKPEKLIYINDLNEDLTRRDFKINTLCMNSKGNIFDLYNAKKDIKNKIISSVGNVDDKFKEDPLRILRAIRFATILKFKLDNNLEKSIINNSELVSSLSIERIRGELNKILLSNNFKVGLGLLKRLGILDVLKIEYSNDLLYSSDLIVMYSQLEMDKNYFNKNEFSNICMLKEIYKYGKIDSLIIYKYGLYLSLAAGTVLNCNSKIVNKIYKNMEVSDIKPLNIQTDKIIEILNVEPGKIIKEVKDEIVKLILEGKLKNNEVDIIKYIESRS